MAITVGGLWKTQPLSITLYSYPFRLLSYPRPLGMKMLEACLKKKMPPRGLS